MRCKKADSFEARQTYLQGGRGYETVPVTIRCDVTACQPRV